MKVAQLTMLPVSVGQVPGSRGNQTVGSVGDRAGAVHVWCKCSFAHSEERRIFLQALRQLGER